MEFGFFLPLCVRVEHSLASSLFLYPPSFYLFYPSSLYPLSPSFHSPFPQELTLKASSVAIIVVCSFLYKPCLHKRSKRTVSAPLV